ncbi:tRNA (adenosine(37)-N6)-dimethylallyltransferase MiaA [Carboxydothermus ferrireducens]|uniref:tRNA dimethylallyltransferase n=1 Tax=Carboxydothermus ferrireducens DSM 11255 TaxID=1119529 RepID=A0ABX2REB7_9THEO|nr:tRNA (adenosine(37)-N6)-dimethylallyltransferase MiaA [Carboxydothermus ferrireducens]NYE58163.1 tRNA dimethylallyltransferase [Carboxydothermus ferrireducens DSM 11255]
MSEKLIIIVGPTAVGKSALGIKVAKKINGEIISGDSMQVYKYMDIGTAKVLPEEREGVPHHLIDILEPFQKYSVALFQKEARRLIKEINARGKIPIIVGGTGLYIRSVIDPYDFTDFSFDPVFREKLEQAAKEKGSLYLHQMLEKIDPVAAQKIHSNDLRRIIRALEVYEHTGKPISYYWERGKQSKPQYRLLYYGLTMDRALLYQRINERVDKMIEKGLIAEVKRLLQMGFKESTAMQALGYKEIVQYLEGKITLDEAIYLIKRDTRRFAKRQLTWFRRDPRIKWFDSGKESLEKITEKIITEAGVNNFL